MRDKMLDWTEVNERVEGANKMLDLNYHKEGGTSVIGIKESLSPYSNKRKIDGFTQGATRAVTSP
jgi:hypothetical protein